jgi:hypothetical protein
MTSGACIVVPVPSGSGSGSAQVSRPATSPGPIPARTAQPPAAAAQLAAACAAHALRRSCRLVPDQHGVSSRTTTGSRCRPVLHGIAPLVNRGQNVAIGLTGLPDVPAKRTGATARWKSHWPSSAAVAAHSSKSQLSSIHRPIATRLTA